MERKRRWEESEQAGCGEADDEVAENAERAGRVDPLIDPSRQWRAGGRKRSLCVHGIPIVLDALFASFIYSFAASLIVCANWSIEQ
jgi:hypothetical protein